MRWERNENGGDELLTYIGSDVIMPGMLTVVTDIQANASYVPWSLNAYLFGGVAFQWLLGPLSDRFVRRPLLLTGCALFTLSFLVTSWANNIHLFTLLRFIQGMGLGFVVVVSYPALQESFTETDAIRLIALSPLLLMHNLGLSKLHYALWQLPIFGAIIAGNITLNFIAERFKIGRLLLLSAFTVFFGLILLLIVGMSIYAFGFGICNATLYRITLFSCSHGLGAISAILGMVSVSVFSIGGSLLAIAGAVDSLSSYIIAVAIPAGFAPFLIINLLRDKKNNSVVAESANL